MSYVLVEKKLSLLQSEKDFLRKNNPILVKWNGTSLTIFSREFSICEDTKDFNQNDFLYQVKFLLLHLGSDLYFVDSFEMENNE